MANEVLASVSTDWSSSHSARGLTNHDLFASVANDWSWDHEVTGYQPAASVVCSTVASHSVTGTVKYAGRVVMRSSLEIGSPNVSGSYDYGDLDTSVFAGNWNMACCSDDGQHVYQGGNSNAWRRGFFASHDYGLTWERCYLHALSTYYGFEMCLSGCSADGSQIFACLQDGYSGYVACVTSDDYGETWDLHGHANLNNWSNAYPESFWISRDLQHIQYRQSSHSQMRSNDGGITWLAAPANYPANILGNDDGSFMTYFNSWYGGCAHYRSTDMGATFSLLYQGSYGSARRLMCMSADGSISYGYDATGWFISYNQGETFTLLPAGITAATYGLSLKCSPDGRCLYYVSGPNSTTAGKFHFSRDYGQTWSYVNFPHETFTAGNGFCVSRDGKWAFVSGYQPCDPLIRIWIPEYGIKAKHHMHASVSTSWEWEHGSGRGYNLFPDPQWDNLRTDQPSNWQPRSKWMDDGGTYSWSGSHNADPHVDVGTPYGIPEGTRNACYWYNYDSPFAGTGNSTQTKPFPVPPELRNKQVTGYVEWVATRDGTHYPTHWCSQLRGCSIVQLRGFLDPEWAQYSSDMGEVVAASSGPTGIIYYGNYNYDADLYRPLDLPSVPPEWKRKAGIWSGPYGTKGGLQLAPATTMLAMALGNSGNDVVMWFTNIGVSRYYHRPDLPYRDGDFPGWAWSGDEDDSYSYGPYGLGGSVVHHYDWGAESIIIDDGAAVTEDVTVDLDVSGVFDFQPPEEMSFSTDGVTWTEWEPYAETKTLDLPPLEE